MEAARLASLATFGTDVSGNTPDSFLHSKLIILWGWNPAISRFGSETLAYLQQAKKAGIKVQTYTVGFEPFCEYVLGNADGIPKNPVWAAEKTGVPVASIYGLAREYGGCKPAALYTGWAPGRSACGEQFHRAACTLAAMTGNIGVKGGFASGSRGLIGLGALNTTLPLPDEEQPLVHITDVYDALLQGTSGGFPSDIIEDPQHHPFPTPSGKIEIYSQMLAERQNPLLPPLPTYCR